MIRRTGPVFKAGPRGRVQVHFRWVNRRFGLCSWFAACGRVTSAGDTRLVIHRSVKQERNAMAEELTELHERAEQGRERPDMAPITLTMAVLAVLVAAVSLMGHRTHTEEIILQNKVTDQWAYYQA